MPDVGSTIAAARVRSWDGGHLLTVPYGRLQTRSFWGMLAAE